MKQAHMVFEGEKGLWRAEIQSGRIEGKTFFVESRTSFYHRDYQRVLDWLQEELKNRA